MIKPESKYELMNIIQEAMDKEGPEVDLGFIDTSLITDMSNLFYNSKFNGDISGWNTGSVMYMNGLFQDSLFNGNIDDWNVSSVVDMSWIFRRSNFNRDISSWNISSLRNVDSMFFGSLFDQNLYKWSLIRPDLTFDLDPNSFSVIGKWIEYEKSSSKR